MKIHSKNIILSGRRAFTILEMMIAFAIFSMAIAVSVSSFSFFSAGVPMLENEVFAQQAARNASNIIEKRLSQASEIVSPFPVKSSPELIFKEVDGRNVKLKLDANDPASPLQSYDAETDALESIDRQFFICIKNVEKIDFTTLSPAAVMIRIKFKKKSSNSKGLAESAFFVRLKNANATQ